VGKTLQKKDFEILDSIRGIAALYVAIGHCRGILWIGGGEFLKLFPRSSWNFWDYIMFGSSMLTRLAVEFVIVFFVLSGFSIAHSLSGNKSILQFYKRRLIRIYPSYVVALIWAGIIFAVTRFFFPGWYDGSHTQFAFLRTMQMNNYFQPSVILKNLFYMPGEGFITPFWSLTYEIIFYILAPFIIRYFRYYLPGSLILFFLNLLFPATVQSFKIPLYLHDFFFVYNIYFVIGICIYRKFSDILDVTKQISKKAFTILLLILLGLLYGLNIYFQTETVYSFIVSAALSLVLIIFFIQYTIRLKPLMKVGRFSYTLYITHFASIYLYLAIYRAVFKPDVDYILNYFVWMPAVLFCLILAYLQYFLVERQTKRILNSLRTAPPPIINPISENGIIPTELP
jgi:peptidoglycan/LPS O-acetylase OafA/YrhL